MTEQSNEVTPEMEQEQSLDSEQAQQPNEFEVKYKELQADYTRKAQELAELKKAQQSSDFNEEEKQLYEWNKEKGFVTKEDLAKFQEQQQNEFRFQNMLEHNPDLKKFESALRTLQQAEGGNYEEIAIKHGFTSQDKLAKAKESRSKMVGSDNKQPPAQKRITDMSPQEYEKRKEANGVGYSAGLMGSSSI